jgi:hypothetical protein
MKDRTITLEDRPGAVKLVLGVDDRDGARSAL